MRLRTDRPILGPYLTAGITADWTDYLLAYQAGGADVIEVGIPFSDPTLDGPTIQEASDRALSRGITIDRILADLSAIRSQVTIPLVAMTYANPVVRRGEAAFCAALKAAGVSGLIVPDLPLDEIDPLSKAADDAGIALVLLAAPSTGEARLREICERSRGFIYAISVMGTTGARAEIAASAETLVRSLKAGTDTPVLLGFGISTPAQARAAATFADGVAVGAALMRKVLDGAPADELGAVVAGLREGLDGAAYP
jgi:tryptophan synthase alpha chain